MIRALYVLPGDPGLQAGDQGHHLGRGRRAGDLGGQEHPQEGTDPDQRSQTGFPEEDPLQRQEL